MVINMHGMSCHAVIYSSLNRAAKPTSPLAFVVYWAAFSYAGACRRLLRNAFISQQLNAALEFSPSAKQ